jgi:hypothetical protein
MSDYSNYLYYKGEKENPFDKTRNNTAKMAWWYEKVYSEMGEKILDSYLKEYISMGLVDFESTDSTPITLKALLFNRFAKGYDARIFALDDFRNWYVEKYKGTN